MKMPRAWTAEQQLQTLRWTLRSGFITEWGEAVDGGANSGGWSDEMRLMFERVHAFEPAPDQCEKMRKRFRSASEVGPGSNVTIHEAALLDRSGLCTLHHPPKRSASTAAFVRATPDGTIRAVALDDLGLGRVGLLKLDLEGAEYLALQGARRTIKRCRPVLIVEVCKHGKRYGIRAEQTIALIEGMGYRKVYEAEPDIVFAPC